MKYKFLYVAALTAMVASLYGCSNKQTETTKEDSDEHSTEEIIFTPEQAAQAGLQTEIVAKGNFATIIKTSGQILASPGEEITVVATTSGVVSYAKKSLTDGMATSKGEPLFTISAQNMANGDPIAKARAEFEAAKKEFERAEKLSVDKIVSDKEFEQARLRYQTAKATYEGISQNAFTSGVVVKSPISGYIKTQMVKSGDYVNAGDAIAVVTQSHRLQLRADVSERYFEYLPQIRNANFKSSYKSDVYNISKLNGRLLSYGKASSTDSYYIPVTFEFDNVINVVPGSFAEIYLESTPRKDVMTIPVSALTEEQGVYFVYIQLDEEGYKKQEVELGQNNGERVEILRGLDVGQTLVVKGAYQVKLAANAGAVPEGHSH